MQYRGAITVSKSIALNKGYRIAGYVQRSRQPTAVLERVPANAGEHLGKRQTAGQPTTIVKRIIAYERDRVGDGQRSRQIAAEVESLFPYAHDGASYDQGGVQGRAVIERRVANGHHRVGNLQRADKSCTLAKGLVADSYKFVAKSKGSPETVLVLKSPFGDRGDGIGLLIIGDLVGNHQIGDVVCGRARHFGLLGRRIYRVIQIAHLDRGRGIGRKRVRGYQYQKKQLSKNSIQN